MINEERLEKISEIGKYWAEQMPMMAMEECGELIQAISKCERARIPNFDETRQNLIEEMGDVIISIYALADWYLITPEDICDYIDTKINTKY